MVKAILSILYNNERAKNEIPKRLIDIQKGIYQKVVEQIDKTSSELFEGIMENEEFKSTSSNRILIEGLAGSGKTFLGKSFAEYYARKSCLIYFIVELQGQN
ncbi:MAG: hypothetical protein ACP5KG_00145 [Myxococcota bacterium]